MRAMVTVGRFAAMTIILSLSACALWFVPESRSRGHVFDDAVRGKAQLSEKHSRELLSLHIQRRFPPGTPLDDVIGHIESAGGHCSMPERAGTKPGRGSATCTYANSNYFAMALMGMGPPDYRLAENEWTVIVTHSEGKVQRYEIENEVILHILSRDDYFEGLERQRAEEELVGATDWET